MYEGFIGNTKKLWLFKNCLDEDIGSLLKIKNDGSIIFWALSFCLFGRCYVKEIGGKKKWLP
jgi:hypothetical protein